MTDDNRPFEVEVHLTTGYVISASVYPKDIAPRLAGGEFPDLYGRDDREAIRSAAFTIYEEAVSRDPAGDGLTVYDHDGRTWAIPYRSIAAVTFKDPVMPHEERRTGFRPEAPLK